MSAAVAVPAKHRRALEFLAELGEEAWEALSSSLEGSTALRIAELEATFRQAISDSGDELSRLSEALTSMLVSMSTHGGESHTMAQGVGASSDLKLDNGLRSILVDRLLLLLSHPRVRLVGKATTIVTSHYRIFHTCGIVTDIRPIFAERPDERPLAAGLTHTLRLGFYENGQLKSNYLVLDNDDLERVVSEATRALEKARSLEGLISELGMQLYGRTEEGVN